MVFAALSFVAGGSIAYFFFKYIGSRNSLNTLNSPQDSLNLQYNEMISEVSVLVRESVEKANLDREIELARSVQSTISPHQSAIYEQLTVAGRCYVAGSCGGDWWHHTSKDNKVVVWLGDVIGHGIASALVASACRAIASSSNLGSFERPISDWVSRMSDVVYEMTGGELYVTVICLKIDMSSGKAELCNASHPPTIQIGSHSKSPTKVLSEPSNPPVGQEKGLKYQSLEFTLDSGECLFVMTDGLLDMPPPATIRWNLKGLTKFLSASFHKKPSATFLVEDVDALFKNELSSLHLPDDVTFATVYRQ